MNSQICDWNAALWNLTLTLSQSPVTIEERSSLKQKSSTIYYMKNNCRSRSGGDRGTQPCIPDGWEQWIRKAPVAPSENSRGAAVPCGWRAHTAGTAGAELIPHWPQHGIGIPGTQHQTKPNSSAEESLGKLPELPSTIHHIEKPDLRLAWN